jgi:hypothetical protein
MKIKEKFELIYGSSGEVYNVLPLSMSTISAYKMGDSDVEHLNGLVRVYSRVKNHPATNFVNNHLEKVIPIDMEMYPLPGFVTKSGIPVINVNAISSPVITDYSASDIFAMYVYTLALHQYINISPLPDMLEEHVSAYIYSIFMKLFGKKSGLIGAYRSLQPKLRFLIGLYVHIGMFGHTMNDKATGKLAASLYFDPRGLNLNFNFESTVDFIRSLKANNIIQISENKFSTTIINMGGVTSLPMFEDIPRLFATVLASTISGNSLFSGIWSKVNNKLFNKLVYFSLRGLK